MSSTQDQNRKALLHRLATEELGFCCMFSFIRETNRWSQNKVAEAMGVTAPAIRYWRDKKRSGQLLMCPRCRAPQTQLELNRRADGKVYFRRSVSHSFGGRGHNSRKILS